MKRRAARMTPGLQVVLSGSLTFGVPIVLALRELVMLRRSGNDRDDGDDRKPAPPSDLPGLPKLPACLIVQPPVKRPARVPELV